MMNRLLSLHTFSKALVTFGLTYLLCWVFTYAFIMDFDFRFIRSYFLLTWSGGLELPGYIQVISVIATIIIAPVLLFFLYIRKSRLS